MSKPIKPWPGNAKQRPWNNAFLNMSPKILEPGIHWKESPDGGFCNRTLRRRWRASRRRSRDWWSDNYWPDMIDPMETLSIRSAGRNEAHAAGQGAATSPDTDFFHDTNWFAIHTKRQRESFAACSIRAVGVEVFLPCARLQQPAARGNAESREPLFPGYLFARFCPDLFLSAVACCPGVLQVVNSGQFPIPVEEKVVREIQNRVEPDGLIRIESRSLKPGARISIEGGPFEGMMGRVEREMTDQGRVAILLETLWQAHVLVEKRWVQAEAA
jgi:transcriptional antiterminator RfaH